MFFNVFRTGSQQDDLFSAVEMVRIEKKPAWKRSILKADVKVNVLGWSNKSQL